jgi:hypothetical protein
MAEMTLLFRATPAQIGSLVLDASVTENHQAEVEVTEHPVEAGANIADHTRAKPETLTIEGIVSNTPLNRTQTRRLVESMGVVIESSSVEDSVFGQPGHAEAAYATLRGLKDAGQLLTVVTGLRVYEDMVMTSLVIPRDARTGEALRFTASFKQVRLVKNKTTTQVVAKEPKAKGKVKTGKQPTPEEIEAASAKGKEALGGLIGKSTLKEGVDFIRGR